MKKTFRRIISLLVAVSMVLTSFVSVFATYPDGQGYENGRMFNKFIQYAINSVGRYTIGTTYGNLTSTNDDQKNLLYDHPNPGTSRTTFKIDGISNYFSSQIVTHNANDLSSIAIQNTNKINIKEELKIVNNSNTGKADVVQIKYTVLNQDNVSHTVGSRIMMDVELGDNDSAPFRIPSIGDVTTEKEFVGANIPTYWQAFDSLTNPSVIAQGSLLRTNNKPDKVQFVNWGRIETTLWDYNILPNVSNGDSAVAIYWNPAEIRPGEFKEYVTYYGLSEFIQDLSPPLLVTLSSTENITATIGGYKPNPITISGYVQVITGTSISNVSVKINLPKGFLVDGSDTIPLGLVTGGRAAIPFIFKVVVPEKENDTSVGFNVVISGDNVASKTLQSTIFVPASIATQTPENIKHYQLSKYAIGTLNASEQLTKLIIDPVDAATGNFVQTETDITVDGFNPITFSRVYNSIDIWSSVLGNHWHSNYDTKLKKESESVVVITFADGHLEEFTKNASGIFEPMPGKYGRVEFTDGHGYVLTQKDKTKYIFDLMGNLTKIEYITGNSLNLSYEAGRLLKVENPCGSLTFQYTLGLISKITDNFGRSVEYVYVAGNLTSFKNVEGNTTTYFYDDKNRLTNIIDPLGNAKVTNVYDEKYRVIKQTMADGTVNTMVYDDVNKTTTLTERNGSKVMYKWDDKFRIYETGYINGNEKAVFNDKNQRTQFTDKNGNVFYYEYDNNGNILKETDALGQISTFTYDSNNKLSSISKPDGSIYTYGYDANGNMILAKDPLGRELKMEYNEKSLPNKIILPDGSFSELQYDERGNATAVKDPLGNLSTFDYDTLNRVVSITKPEGNKVEFEYSPKGKIKKTTYPDQTFSTTTYDPRGLVTEEADTNGGITKYNYNSMGKVIEKIDPVGGISKYDYDNMWNVSKATLPDGSETTYNYNGANQLESVKDAQGNVTRLEHDSLDNVTNVTDPRGAISQMAYDKLNRLTQTTNANNALTKFEYRYDGKITKILDALNQATEYNYDSAGQLISVKDALGNITNYSYNIHGLVSTVKDAKGSETKYLYNSNGKVTKVTKPDGTFDTLSYDKNGNLTKVVDTKGNITKYIYDNMDRLTKIQNAIGGTKTVSYTKTGKVASLKDENNNTTFYNYDLLDRLIEVNDPKGNKTTYVYDSVGNLSEVHRFGGLTQATIDGMTLRRDDKDQKNKDCEDKKISQPNYIASSNEIVTKYQYDKLGNVIKETNPANKVVIYSYDSNGNLISKTDREGLITKFEYDAVNNLKKTVYNDGKQVEYNYNPLNQVVRMTDWLGTNTFELDSLGRILKAKNYQNKELEYKWTATGEKESIKYPDGSLIKYEFDSMGRLTKVNDSQNKSIVYKFDNLGNVVEKFLPNSFKTKYSYDKLQRLTTMINSDEKGKLIDNYTYKYDSAGNKVNSLKNNEERQYKYDSNNQLIEIAEFSKPDKTLQKYFYDTLGNRVRLENWKNGKYEYSSDYKYDNLDRLTEITGKAYDLFGDDKYSSQGIKMEYDMRGNLVKTSSDNKVLSEFVFDSTNKLIQAVNKEGEKSLFTYDGFGRRVGMTYDESPDHKKVTELSYLHDVTKPYDNVLMISSNKKDEKSKIFTYGLEMLSMNIVKDNAKIDRLYYLQDELGSPIKLLDDKGKIVSKFEYDEFGRPVKPKDVEKWDKKGNVFAFTGYMLDEGTGLLYAQARYYMPDVGRFVSEDSYKGELLESQSLNQYVYCVNNPVNKIDPSGFDSYILYDIGATSGDRNHTFADQANIEKVKYTNQYGTDTHVIGISSAIEFQTIWNRIGRNGKGIDAIQLIFHGSSSNGTGFMYLESDGSRISSGCGAISNTDTDISIYDLKRKQLDLLYFSSCNSANPDIANTGSAFSSFIQAKEIIGWDGGAYYNYNTQNEEPGGYGSNWIQEAKRQPSWYKTVPKTWYGKPLRQRQGKTWIQYRVHSWIPVA